MKGYGKIGKVAAVFTSPVAGHSFIINASNEIFAIGPNSCGQLGLGDFDWREGPSKFPSFKGHEIREFACGAEYTLVSKLNGQVFSFGNADRGQLGFHVKDPTMISSPRVIDRLLGENVVQLACGCSSSYCMTSTGDLFTFGWNCHGQLGDGSRDSRNEPSRIRFPGECKVSSVSAGWMNAVALGVDGRVFSWGRNISGQLGRDGDENIPQSVLIDCLGRPIQVACGEDRTFVVSSMGELYGWGFDTGGLGIGSIKSVSIPKKIPFPENFVEKVSPGGYHTICYSRDSKSRKIYIFGFNRYAQLCLGHTHGGVNTPTEFPQDVVEGKKVIQGEIGRLHSFLITSDGACYGCGMNAAFGAKNDIQSPLLIMKEVKFVNNYLLNSLVEYIRRQGTIVDGGRIKKTVDSRITVEGAGGSKLEFEVDAKFVEMRFGRKVEKLTFVEELTDDMGDLLLIQLYGERLEPESPDLRQSGLESTVLECMCELYRRKEEGGDVQIVSNKGTVHWAHKFVLVARREYFRAMFEGGFLESMTNEVRMEMTLGEPFERYLHYIYTGTMDFSPSEARNILPFVEYFDEGGDEDIMLRMCCL